MKAKEWRIYFTPAREGLKSRGFDSKDDAVKFIADHLSARGMITNIQWKGHEASFKVGYGLIKDAKYVKVKSEHSLEPAH